MYRARYNYSMRYNNYVSEYNYNFYYSLARQKSLADYYRRSSSACPNRQRCAGIYIQL